MKKDWAYKLGETSKHLSSKFPDLPEENIIAAAAILAQAPKEFLEVALQDLKTSSPP